MGKISLPYSQDDLQSGALVSGLLISLVYIWRDLIIQRTACEAGPAAWGALELMTFDEKHTLTVDAVKKASSSFPVHLAERFAAAADDIAREILGGEVVMERP